jgi:hypothetical protein
MTHEGGYPAGTIDDSMAEHMSFERKPPDAHSGNAAMLLSSR